MTFQPKILLVDDDPVSRQLIARMLESLGFSDVTGSQDGLEAWNLVKTSLEHLAPFDLVITDWKMPRFDGLKLLSVIRAHEASAQMKVIMLTGLHEREEVAKAATYKVSDYIVKPANVETLRAKVEKVLGQKCPGKSNLNKTGT